MTCSDGLVNRQIKICSWNICGAKDKLNNSQILKFLYEYDIIWILESKLVKTTCIPGFAVYHNVSRRGAHRGGVMLLVKHEFLKYIVRVNLDLESQIWLELSCYPNTNFGGIYVPPEDSPYYDPAIMANICAAISDKEQAIVVGDFNARVGKPRMMNERGEEYEYIGIIDNTQNAPGRSLLNICKEKSLVVANHLKYQTNIFGGNLTFKKGNKWISEIDQCIIHTKMLPALVKVEVRQDFIGSDHAPICASLNTLTAELLGPILREGAKNLGKSYIRPTTKSNQLLRTKPYKETNVENFKSYMSAHPPPVLTVDNIEGAINTSFQTMRDSAKESMQITNVNGNI